MIKNQRDKLINEQTKDKIEQYLKVLEEASELEKSGDKDGVEKMFNNLKEEVAKECENIEHKMNTYDKNKHEKFDKDALPDKGQLLGEKDGVILIAFDESYRELFLTTEEFDTCMPYMMKKEEFRDMLWEESVSDTALYYGICKGKNEYIGYVGINDTSKPIWEVSMILLPEYRYQGYGKVALTILFDEIHRRTGERLFRARVETDNYASQALLRKMGARTNGISEFMLHGDDLDRFQKENISLIDEKLEAVAEEFCVDSEDLLGHVLEYLIDWPQE